MGTPVDSELRTSRSRRPRLVHSGAGRRRPGGPYAPGSWAMPRWPSAQAPVAQSSARTPSLDRRRNRASTTRSGISSAFQPETAIRFESANASAIDIGPNPAGHVEDLPSENDCIIPLNSDQGMAMSAWVIRQGREWEQHLEQKALEKGVLAIRFDGMQKSDLTAVRSKQEVKSLYERLNPNEAPRRVAMRVGEIWRYKEELQPGDLVVMPRRGTHTVAVGEVSGGYGYCPKSLTGHVHCRRVKWINEQVREECFGQDQLGRDLQKSMGANPTVYRPLPKRDGQSDRNAQAERRLRTVASESV